MSVFRGGDVIVMTWRCSLWIEGFFFMKGFVFADSKNGWDSVFDLFSPRHQRLKESLGQLWPKFDFMRKKVMSCAGGGGRGRQGGGHDRGGRRG